ncbi:hypothetical protein BD626DRAFT_573942 [Schizophyllum amplum]|uniref:MYND-type domain-containing protein n=1 Tax=Schizophyllum amplum TaxID=97359 RepID=A0A550C042_9AGAR|nr:hypothetical protein BD626DRAFT_573942 [Auriculariopsis ampla]
MPSTSAPLNGVQPEWIDHATAALMKEVCSLMLDLSDAFSLLDSGSNEAALASSIRQIKRVLFKRELLHEVLARDLPQNVVWVDWLQSAEGNSIARLVGGALDAAGFACRLGLQTGDRRLSEGLGPSFFARAFLWADFLLPMGQRQQDLDAIPTHFVRQVLVTTCYTTICTYVTICHHCCTTRRTGAGLCCDERLAAFLIRGWSKWLYDPYMQVVDVMTEKTVVTRVQIFLMTVPHLLLRSHCVFLRRSLAAEFQRAFEDRPTELALLLADYMRLIGGQPPLWESLAFGRQNGGETLVHDWCLFARTCLLCRPLGLSGRCPAPLVAQAVNLLKRGYYVGSDTRERMTIYRLVVRLCWQDVHNARCALRRGVFGCITVMPSQGSEIHLIMHGCIREAVLGLRRYNQRILRDMIRPGVDVDEDVAYTAKLMRMSYRILEEEEADWASALQVCGVVGCSRKEKRRPKLYHCRCGEVLYCSKGCQRAHWNSGHKDSCSQSGLPPRIVVRAVAFARLFVQKEYWTLVRRYGAASMPQVEMTLGPHVSYPPTDIDVTTAADRDDLRPEEVMVVLRFQHAEQLQTVRVMLAPRTVVERTGDRLYNVLTHTNFEVPSGPMTSGGD